MTLPTCPNKSNPIMHLVLRSVTRNVAPFTSQPADRRFVFNAPNTQIVCLLSSANFVVKFSLSDGMNLALFDLSISFLPSPNLRKRLDFRYLPSTVVFDCLFLPWPLMILLYSTLGIELNRFFELVSSLHLTS